MSGTTQWHIVYIIAALVIIALLARVIGRRIILRRPAATRTNSFIWTVIGATVVAGLLLMAAATWGALKLPPVGQASAANVSGPSSNSNQPNIAATVIAGLPPTPTAMTFPTAVPTPTAIDVSKLVAPTAAATKPSPSPSPSDNSTTGKLGEPSPSPAATPNPTPSPVATPNPTPSPSPAPAGPGGSAATGSGKPAPAGAANYYGSQFWAQLPDTDSNGVPDDSRMDFSLVPGVKPCPDVATVQAALGLRVDWVSGCLFKWNSDGRSHPNTPCPKGWDCTLDIGPRNIAVLGDGSTFDIDSGSFFPVPDRTFADLCGPRGYFTHENIYAYFAQDPPTEAGNFKCDAGAQTAGVPNTTTVPNPSPTPAPAPAAAAPAPAFDPLTLVIASDQSKVTCTAGDPGVYVCDANKTNVTFTHPGGESVIDIWAGFKFPAACTSTVSDQTRTLKCPAGTSIVADRWTVKIK